MRLALPLAALAAAALAVASLAATPPKKLSANLVKNPGAELGPVTADNALEPLAVPAWETTGGFFAAAYNGFRWAPDPPNRTKASGAKFFVGCFAAPGQTVNRGTATQVISIARWRKAIDKGTVALQLDAELGGYDGTENRAFAEAVFLDGQGKVVGRKASLVGPTYVQRVGVTRVEPRSVRKPVPAGAREIRVKLTGTRAGSGPCGFIDKVGAALLAMPS